MGKSNPNRLLVEGRKDQFAIASLMAAHIPWGDSPEEWPVLIREFDGVENLLERGRIALEWKASGMQRLGVVVDANDDFEGRWDRVRDRCAKFFPNLPRDLPQDGLVRVAPDQRRLGVWIMPDNRSRGMLETLLKFLVPDQDNPLWKYAQSTVEQARRKGASFKEQHHDKAEVHTWLAWQDEPGLPLGLALIRKCLDPNSKHAMPFVRWFKKLFEL